LPGNNDRPVGAVLVVGGGIGGVQASLDLAESGFKVYLVEKGLSIGGVMAQLDKTFPTNDCSMCILSPKLVDCGRHRNIELLTNAEVENVSGEAGRFRITVRKKARFVDPLKCTACGDCAKECPVHFPNEYEECLAPRSAIYHPFDQATPSTYGIDKRGEPPCRATCPIHVNAQGYVALISQGKFKEALDLVRERNPFPGVTGRVCHHPCEAVCERGKVDEPVAICALKRAAADLAGEEEPWSGPDLQASTRKTVGVVGSGPAGLLCAFDLAQRGHKVTVFEALPVVGGMLAVGIPSYRLPRDVLAAEAEVLERMGVEIRVSTPIGEGLSFGQLLEAHDAVFMAPGCHVSRCLGMPGEDLDGVVGAVEFLRAYNLGQEVEVGRRVVVVGGGNAAIDAARTALRLGAEKVTIVYRRSRVEMPANEEEIEEAEHEGIEILYLANPTKAMGAGRLERMECIRMALGEPDASGRRRPVPVEGSEFMLDVDMLIPAISQSPDLTYLGDGHGIELTRWGTPAVDEQTLQTSVEKVFAGGDAVTGPATYIEAMAAGRKAAESIHRYLMGEEMSAGREGEGPQETDVQAAIEGVAPRGRAKLPALPVQDRAGSFDEVVSVLSPEDAKAEAERCLACGGCAECMECVRVCEADAVVHEDTDELLDVEVGSIILTPGFDEFQPEVIGEYGYGRYPNVVTSIEFERILSASGPFKGKILRPSDHAHPTRLAWINCVGSRDPKHGRTHCSSVCCMYGAKEAVIAKEHASDIEATIFYMDLRAYGKDFDRYIDRAQDEYGVRFIRSRVSSLNEDPATNNLWLTYEDTNGRLIREEFDMVVLSVGLDPSRSAKELSEKFGVELESHGFAKTSVFEPLKATVPGIFVGGAFAGPKDVPETVAQASAVAGEAGSILGDARGTLVTEKEYVPEIDVTNERPRIGAFICHCGINIGAYVDVPAVVEYARTLPNVAYAGENLYTCSQDTQEQMKAVIKEHGLNRVVVASCTPRTHEPLFQDTIREAGLNRNLFDMANIRDQNSWVHMHEKVSATDKAKDLVRMAVMKANLITPLYTRQVPVCHRAVVIGGGLAGMTAALRLGDSGYETVLVEKEQELGGNLRHIHYSPEGDDVQAHLAALVDGIAKHPKVLLRTGTVVDHVDGYVGNFKSTLTTADGSTEELEHGVVIVATGASEYTPTEYLYGHHPSVLTQRELEERLAEGTLPGEGPIVMIQCVGSRNDERPYCSRVCCLQAAKNALRIKASQPERDVYILYRDMRTYGFKEDFYQEAREKGVLFIRFDRGAEPVLRTEGADLLIETVDPVLQETLRLRPQFLVLSAATVAPHENEQLAKMLKVPLNQDGFFLEAHMKLRPVDFATDGVFLCGLAHGPKLIEESISQANAAASRALTVLSKDEIETVATVSRVREAECAGCGLCVEICPYNAIELQDKKVLGHERTVAVVNEALCKGCGACAAGCRSGAIDLGGFTDEQVVAQIEALTAGVTE
jgi:heterodisulfide reductase subunit A-like polyferredoxin